MRRFLAAVLVSSSLVNAAPPPKVVDSPNGETSVMTSELVCNTKNQKAGELYDKANDAEERGDLEEARKLFEQSVKLDPKFCDAMDDLGLMYRRQGKLDEAISWYRKSIALVSKNGTARMNLAAALRMKKDYPESAKEYSALIKVMPKNAEGYYGLGSVLLDQGKPADALKPLLEAEKLYLADRSPYVGDAQTMLGRAYFRTEAWANAVKYLELVIAASPNDGHLNLQLGTSLAKLKKGAKAKPYLIKARDQGATIPGDVAAEAGL
jgi:tetratricopeptide (TPR) repeat protein